MRPFPRAVLFALLGGGVFSLLGLGLLDLQDRQARDVKRALDLEDLETALLRVLATTGTLPPADAPSWCGVVNAPENAEILAEIERSLRETKKYAKAEKPFPADPRFLGTEKDYAYWKTSPVSFELLSELEADANNSRPLDLKRCELRFPLHGARGDGTGDADRSPEPANAYDYAISSLHRTPL